MKQKRPIFAFTTEKSEIFQPFDLHIGFLQHNMTPDFTIAWLGPSLVPSPRIQISWYMVEGTMVASEMAFQPIDIAPVATYGATRTTTFTTITTASSSEGTFMSILFRKPPDTEPLQYTIPPPLVVLASKVHSSSLPILVVMDVVAIIVNTNGVPVSTGTLTQTLPPQSTAARISAAKLLMDPNCSSFSCWPPGQRIGTAVAISLFIVGVMGLLYWGFCCKPRARGNRQDLESGRADARPRHVETRRISRSRSRSLSSGYHSSSSSSRIPAIQSYVRTRSRSRARAHVEPWGGVNSRGPQMQRPRQPTLPSHTHSKDFAAPAAVGLATAAALGTAPGGRRAGTSAPRRSSSHEESASRSRRLGGEASNHVNKYFPRARRQAFILSSNRSSGFLTPLPVFLPLAEVVRKLSLSTLAVALACRTSGWLSYHLL
jgi:hypothetical protein